MTHYMAAVYLQSMWRMRLGHYYKQVSELPDYFSSALGLPGARDLHGKAGLYALAEWHASRSPYRFNHLSAYMGVADLLFQSLKLKRRHHESTANGGKSLRQDPIEFEQNFRTLETMWQSTPKSSEELA
jgi:hypothetical protein